MDIKDKILSGWVYRIGSSTGKLDGQRTVSAFTGKGGIELYIDTCRKEGIPDSFIEESIEVKTKTHGWLPLSVLIVEKK